MAPESYLSSKNGGVKPLRNLERLVALLFLLLIGRLLWLQVVNGDRYLEASIENQLKVVPLPAARGMILDRNSEVLVENQPSYTISILPRQFAGHSDQTAHRLGWVLEMPPAEIVTTFNERKSNPYLPLKLKRDVDMGVISIVEEHRLNLPGVIVQVEPKRLYHYGTSASHVLGYIGEVTEAELMKQRTRDYNFGDIIGKAGIEKQFENILHGRGGQKYVEVDAKGRELGEYEDLAPILPQSGIDVYLTLDSRLQDFIESKLEAWGGGSAVVALNPRTGEILALSSHPSPDPNLFSTRIPSDLWLELNQNPLLPLINRTIQNHYPPGSIFKLVTAAAALEAGIITETTTFRACRGSYVYGNRIHKCWLPGGHGRLALKEALVQSCDSYFYQVAKELGLENLSKMAKAMGLGKVTGVSLPQEIPGLIPDLDWYRKRKENGEEGWTPGMILNLGIGQGEILMTPLQMAAFIGAFSTDGVYYQPYLAYKAVTRSGQERLIKQSRVKLNFPLRPETIAIIKDALVGVVNDDKGTGISARLNWITIAGKTGTAQNPFGDDHAIFAAYAPAEEPLLAISIVLENSGTEGTAAKLRLAREIFSYYFQLSQDIAAD
ncbi:penicillin-binding protein 2 [candidate division KSB1 bacterium]